MPISEHFDKTDVFADYLNIRVLATAVAALNKVSASTPVNVELALVMAIHKIVINNVLNFAALNNTWITTVRRTADPQTAPANQTGEGDSDTLVFDEHNYAVVAAEGTVPKKFDTRFVYDFEVPLIYAKTQIHCAVGNQSGATIPAVDFRIFYTMKKVGARELAQYLAQ